VVLCPTSLVALYCLGDKGMALHYPSYDLYGTKITPMTEDELLELIASHVDSKEPCVVASQNVHGLHVRLWDAAFRKLHSLSKTYVHIDGMPIVALCRLSGINASRKHRVGITHFIWPLLTHAADEGWRVFYVGSTKSVLDAGEANIRRRLPHIKLKTHHGYFHDPQESAAAAREIVAFGSQLVLVGMGMGWQERWILQNLRILSPACVVTAGACIEYVAGTVKTAPGWLSHSGCEWLFRLADNPSRFWYRYIVEPWFVLANIVWYLSLPQRARLAGRIEELQHIPVGELPHVALEEREAELSEMA
jgi:N-acetylglucosaminyldiphosphoundecaprenol N-acetyl-beta-D-mannosaminyltransferase